MDIFEQALRFAIEKHSGQTRKFSNVPYILHPMEAAAIVGTMTDDRTVLAAAVLHDTVEDTDTTLEELEERFGRQVALLVMTETENKREELPAAETWTLRKEETLIMLSHTRDVRVKMMWLGDKLSNLRSISRELARDGDAIWQSMNQKDPARQEWYYRSIGACLSELSGYGAYREYTELLDKVFAKTEESEA